METDTVDVKASPHAGWQAVFGKLLLLRHPRQAALLGFSGCFACFLGLLPLLYLIVSPGMLLGQSSVGVELLVFFLLGCLLYFQLMSYVGYLSLMRLHPVKNMGLQCALAAVVWPFAGVVLLPGCVRGRHWSSGVAAAASVLCGGLGLFGGWSFAWLLLWGCLGFFVLALVLFKAEDGLSVLAFLPLAAMVVYEGGLLVHGHVLSKQVTEMRHQVSDAVGRSIEEEEFWRRESEGLCLHEEPLKSLVAHKVALDGIASDEDAQARLAELRRTQPAFMRDMVALTALPVRATGHRLPRHGLIVELQLPELLPIRQAAQVCALEMRAEATQRDKVLEANARLEHLRDRCLATATLLARLVGMGIEDMRVEALAFPMAAGTLTAEEWQALLACEPDWEEAFRFAIGDEASSLQALFADGYSLYDLTQVASLLKSLRRFLPQEVSICAQRDYLFALRTLRNLCLSEAMEAEDLEERVRQNQDAMVQEATTNLHVLSRTMLPATAMLPLRLAATRHRLELARLAVEVLAYHRRHGVLPGELGVLPSNCNRLLQGGLVRYEHGEVKVSLGQGAVGTQRGFRLYLEETGVEPYRSPVQFLVLVPGKS